MRPDDLFSKRGSAVLDVPEEQYAPESGAGRSRSRRAEPGPRPGSGRDFDDDFAEGLPERVEEGANRRQRGGVRFRFNGRPVRLPKTLWGRIFSGLGVLLFMASVIAGLLAVRSFFLHDPRFVVESFSSIESSGNTHLTRAQLMSVFGEDVERNIFSIPLAERRAELEQLPWVQHATVMRLLPNHVRILITERTPVALVRQGTQLGMVDAGGVLLDIPADTAADPHYSFPVITSGIGPGDPLSTRTARMKIFGQFMADLDSTGEQISKKVSEVDLSNPEDVKALMFEGTADVLVHFGEEDFLERYRKFEQHLAEWRAQYPKLSSVDMRYDRQIVLDVQAVSETASPQVSKAASQQVIKPASAAVSRTGAPASAKSNVEAGKPMVKPVANATLKPTAKAAAPTAAKSATKLPPASGSATSEEWHMVVVKPHTKESAALAAKAKPAHPSPASPQ